jgi:CBS domain-containing protein
MLVKQIMTPRVVQVDPQTSVKDVALKMQDMDIGCVPVGENGQLVGMITDRDIACRCVAHGRDPEATKVSEVMSRRVTWCRDDQDVGKAARLMGENHVRRLPVLDREERLVGILSLDDLVLNAPSEFSVKVLEAVSKSHWQGLSTR